MRKSSSDDNFLHIVLGCVIIFVVISCLFIDNIYITWTFLGLLGIDALYLTVYHGWRWRRGSNDKIAPRERFLSFLASLMFLFLITGTMLFMQAFCYESQATQADGKSAYLFLNAEYLLRSLACSFQLFTGNIDSNVVDGISDQPVLKGLISLQCFLSFCCTVAIILSLAYARVWAYYKLHRKTKIDSAHNHLYVFFGMNDPSRLLASSIKAQEGDRAVIIFVENRIQDDDDQDGWNSIVGMFTHRRQTFKDVDELDARVTFTEIRLPEVDGTNLDISDILGQINLIKLRNLIQKLSKDIADAQLHIFFMSEIEDDNIRALSVLVQDSTIMQTKDSIKQHFYCHARRNGLNRIVEDIAFKQGLDVRTVDSSYLAVELLKADENNHPVRFVDIDEKNPTTVKSKFNSLIIGFDEVGRDALKFLYEFGAFIDCGATPNDEHRSPFYCIAIDKRMAELEGSFTSFTPAVMAQRNNDDSHSPLVELKSCDCLSSDFYNTILTSDFCQAVNYIVIAVGDDELGMTLAIRILNYIRRVRADLHKLRIYVRSYRSDKEAYMNQIATYYNEGYNKGVKDMSFRNDSVIQLFGQSKDIYSYDMVINEKLTQKGRMYQESYACLRGESTLWDARRKKEQEKGSIDNMRSLRRKELQDLGNALHADTKIYLLKEAIRMTMGGDYDWNDFISRYFDDKNMPQCEGSYDKIKYPLLSREENNIILNLARLEHMRWNASHEMLGYTGPHPSTKDLHSCDERTREHNCLRPWQELDEESKAASSPDWQADYKLFDFSVVDNSILLNKGKLINN